MAAQRKIHPHLDLCQGTESMNPEWYSGWTRPLRSEAILPVSLSVIPKAAFSLWEKLEPHYENL